MQGVGEVVVVQTVKDRIVQMATRLVIEPIFETDFQECSYGFCSRRSAVQASLQICKWLNYGLINVLDIDLKRYFDNRRGHQKAIGAVARHLAEATYWVLKKKELYRESFNSSFRPRKDKRECVLSSKKLGI
jgi:retron-type reverse transcriptase